MATAPDGQQARALARLYWPPAQRAAFDALVGIEAQVGAGIERALEHDVAHARLGWWREELARLSAAEPVHPLTRALRASAAAGSLAGVSGLLDTATWDLAAATFDTRRELDAYCARWSAALVEPLVQLGVPGSHPGPGAAFGQALRELELLNAAADDARRGRLRVPLDELAAAGVNPEELTRSRFGVALSELLRRYHEEARGRLARAAAAFAPAEQAALRGLFVWAAVTLAQSRRVAGALPLATGPAGHSAPLDGWRAWRVARAAQNGRLVLSPD